MSAVAKSFGFSKRKRHISHGASLNLTPMIDMMTILLIFLIKNYSVSPVFLTPTQEITLAPTTSKTGAPDEASLIVGKDGIIVDGKVIVAFKDGKPAHGFENLKTVPELLEVLTKISSQRKSESKAAEVLILQADKSVSFLALKPILRTAGLAGFNDIKFAGLAKD